jgi:hypothetical protein
MRKRFGGKNHSGYVLAEKSGRQRAQAKQAMGFISDLEDSDANVKDR